MVKTTRVAEGTVFMIVNEDMAGEARKTSDQWKQLTTTGKSS